MSDTQPQNAPQQSLKVVAQYLKDLSFENPGLGPLSQLRGTAPEINININVRTSTIPETPNRHTVNIVFKAVSSIKELPLFILDATYTGIFEIVGFEGQILEQILNIQCPAILFPFLRRIIGEKTVDGGYPPLFIDPIDFHSLYLQKINKQPANNPKNENDKGEDVKSVFN